MTEVTAPTGGPGRVSFSWKMSSLGEQAVQLLREPSPSSMDRACGCHPQPRASLGTGSGLGTRGGPPEEARAGRP